MTQSHSSTQSKTLPLALVALGVVFGDIGTSPLYAFKECLEHGSSASDIVGVISLILWSLILLVSVKYVGLILRADNNGEGGILALLALAFPEKRGSQLGRAGVIMTGLGIFGAALLYGDGVITPAISVLSAVEGLELISPVFNHLVIPLTLVILVGLFSVQRYGTGAVGSVFGKVMLLWFACLGIMGLVQVVQHPAILAAFNPWMGIQYLKIHSSASMVVLGSVFLSVTGGEALYADMGHFGHRPIRMAWNCLVLPALALNYMGQGALVLSNPAAASNPFFFLAPGWALWPLIGLATLATIIASQALISGAFSLTTQAMQMGYLPRMQVMHTSSDTSGQIYIPQLNYALGAACVALVIGFRSSSALASAYGIAVTLTMLTTTSLFYFAARRVWKWKTLPTLLICVVFGLIESAFFASNALKVFHGGWLPLCIGAVLFFLMTTWKIGRSRIRKRFAAIMPLKEFVSSISLSGILSESHSPYRVKGTAVFFNSSPSGTPNALLQNLKHNHVIHERNIVLNIASDHVPYVSRGNRLEIDSLDGCFFQITARFGFMEIPTIDEIVSAASAKHFEIVPEKTTFFLGRETLVPTTSKGMGPLRRAAFIVMSRNAQNAAEFFRLPSNRTIEIGLPIEI
ncbi:MAG: potassium transporter Kup [Chthoniobacteraceae bacterium]